MDPFIGEIRMFAGTFAPVGWAICDGSLLPIGDNDALFTLIGTTYGGDGQQTFGLPDMRGRVPVHQGSSYPLGAKAGSETVSLLAGNLPAHTHAMAVQSGAGTVNSPGGQVYAAGAAGTTYYVPADATLAPMAPDVIAGAGGGQPHENMMPFTAVNFIISLQGIFPSQG